MGTVAHADRACDCRCPAGLGVVTVALARAGAWGCGFAGCGCRACSGVCCVPLLLVPVAVVVVVLLLPPPRGGCCTPSRGGPSFADGIGNSFCAANSVGSWDALARLPQGLLLLDLLLLSVPLPLLLPSLLLLFAVRVGPSCAGGYCPCPAGLGDTRVGLARAGAWGCGFAGCGCRACSGVCCVPLLLVPVCVAGEASCTDASLSFKCWAGGGAGRGCGTCSCVCFGGCRLVLLSLEAPPVPVHGPGTLDPDSPRAVGRGTLDPDSPRAVGRGRPDGCGAWQGLPSPPCPGSAQRPAP